MCNSAKMFSLIKLVGLVAMVGGAALPRDDSTICVSTYLSHQSCGQSSVLTSTCEQSNSACIAGNLYTCANDGRVIATKGGCTGEKFIADQVDKTLPVDVLRQDSCMSINDVDVSIHCEITADLVDEAVNKEGESDLMSMRNRRVDEEMSGEIDSGSGEVTTTMYPTALPTTESPTTASPTVTPGSPTDTPTTSAPTTSFPTGAPITATPSATPTSSSPTQAPSATPTTVSPTVTPGSPTFAPSTSSPTTASPTDAPTSGSPTAVPTTVAPTQFPTSTSPTSMPTALPTSAAPTTASPTVTPGNPTIAPSTGAPTTAAPTTSPTDTPSTDSPSSPPSTSSPTSPPTTRAPTVPLTTTQAATPVLGLVTVRADDGLVAGATMIIPAIEVVFSFDFSVLTADQISFLEETVSRECAQRSQGGFTMEDIREVQVQSGSTVATVIFFVDQPSIPLVIDSLRTDPIVVEFPSDGSNSLSGGSHTMSSAAASQAEVPVVETTSATGLATDEGSSSSNTVAILAGVLIGLLLVGVVLYFLVIRDKKESDGTKDVTPIPMHTLSENAEMVPRAMDNPLYAPPGGDRAMENSLYGPAGGIVQTADAGSYLSVGDTPTASKTNVDSSNGLVRQESMC
eukprot:m.209486 g.209486  ORF g.209486 m.209486 type:complete len:627 (+) comp18985_c1_seq1:127-2007(+)